MADGTNPTTDIDYKAEYEKMQAQYDSLKRNFDKTSSEVAEYKRKEKDRMTDEEKRNAELAEREQYYKAIEKENSLYKYKASLSGQISDDKVLTEVAGLYADGKIAEAIAKQNEYFTKSKDELVKSVKAELLKQNPQPTPQGSNVGEIDKKTFNNMGYSERAELYQKNPELYNKLNTN